MAQRGISRRTAILLALGWIAVPRAVEGKRRKRRKKRRRTRTPRPPDAGQARVAQCFREWQLFCGACTPDMPADYCWWFLNVYCPNNAAAPKICCPRAAISQAEAIACFDALL